MKDRPTEARRRLRLSNPRGLHARPCTAIAGLANRFEAELELRHGAQRVDGKRVLEVLTLEAGCGDEIEALARGPDALALLEALESLFGAGFQERD